MTEESWLALQVPSFPEKAESAFPSLGLFMSSSNKRLVLESDRLMVFNSALSSRGQILDSVQKIDRKRECRAGETLCGECKTDMAAKLNRFLTEHPERREKAKDVTDQYRTKRK